MLIVPQGKKIKEISDSCIKHKIRFIQASVQGNDQDKVICSHAQSTII